jgi:hypothetical protein
LTNLTIEKDIAKKLKVQFFKIHGGLGNFCEIFSIFLLLFRLKCFYLASGKKRKKEKKKKRKKKEKKKQGKE